MYALRKCFIVFIMGIFLINFMYAQPEVSTFKELFQVDIKRAEGEIEIDGVIDEAVWEDADIATDFWQKSPFVKEMADPRTEVRLTYDDNFLYVAAMCYQEEKPIITSLKRDEFWDNDGLAIVLDPINAKTNVYVFASSAVGVQMDAIRGQLSDLNSDWSNKWYAETTQGDGYFSIEFAIPFRILRYNEGNPEWGINFVRAARAYNQFHNWTAVPAQFWPVEPAYAGTLKWDHAPKKASGSYNVIPYMTTGITDQVDEGTSGDFNVGVDAKIAVASSLTLDLTINPDFSQIEVDELVTNLTRFNLFLPEKRTFFLENSDVFNDFGSDIARPFFSRTIGLTENGAAVPLYFGARLTGDLRPDVRVGLMNIQQAGNDDSYGQNFTAISTQKKFGRSFIQGMFLNRQSFDGSELVSGDYGRNATIEAAYIREDGQFAGWVGGHTSYKPDVEGDNYFLNTGFAIANENVEFVHDFISMGENYYADMGFVNRIENYDAVLDSIWRLGFNQSEAGIDVTFRPETGNIGRYGFEINNSLVYNPDWSFNERETAVRFGFGLKSGESLGARISNQRINLRWPFSFTDEEPLPKATYTFTAIGARYSSDERKALSYSLGGRIGNFYNGTIKRISSSANFRVQPWGNFGIEYQWNQLDFPDPYGSATISAIQAKSEVGFHRDLIWTTLFQFVDQSDFMGVNSRLQWRFQPMSDLFIVYVDNYDLLDGLEPGRNITNNNRSLVLKLSYWY